MKKYQIKVVNKIQKKTVLEIQELSNTKKYLTAKYRGKYFPLSEFKITITRLIKKPGIQTNLLDEIEAAEKMLISLESHPRQVKENN